MQEGGFSRPFEITEGSRTLKIGSNPIPARPFVMFQESDIMDIDKLALKHIEDSAK